MPIDQKLHYAYNNEHVDCTKEGFIMAPVTFTPEEGNAALEAAYQGARDDNWDGAGSRRVEHSTYKYALQFLQLLQGFSCRIALPDITADTDGEILFDWDEGRRRVFAVSVGRDGTLTFAGLFGHNKSHGREPFYGALPKAIESGLERLSMYADS
jgi:hypothetical protein